MDLDEEHVRNIIISCTLWLRFFPEATHSFKLVFEEITIEEHARNLIMWLRFCPEATLNFNLAV